MADKTALLLEAERRGILPPAQQAVLDEARRRGLVDVTRANLHNRPTPVESTGSPLKLPFMNQAIAGMAGGPVDLVNFGLNLMGIGSEEPFGGSQSIERAMLTAGIDLPDPGQRPETMGERVQRGETIAKVGRYPGGSTMLHFEVYRVGTRKRPRWPFGKPQPGSLVDPHSYLLATVQT